MDENKEPDKAAEEHGWEPVEPGSIEFPQEEEQAAPAVSKFRAPDERLEQTPSALRQPPPEESLVEEDDSREPAAEENEGAALVVQGIEAERRQHDEAVRELMKDIRALRERAKRQKLDQDQLQAEAQRLVSGFLETSDGRTLKRVLPDRASAKTGREKLVEIVNMGLKLKAWDDAAFMVRYNRRFGRDVEEEFKKREKLIAQKKPL